MSIQAELSPLQHVYQPCKAENTFLLSVTVNVKEDRERKRLITILTGKAFCSSVKRRTHSTLLGPIPTKSCKNSVFNDLKKG